MRFNRKLRYTLLATLLILLYCTSLAFAINLPTPQGDIYVQDFANMISDSMEAEINGVARNLDDQTTAQISVVTIDTLGENDIDGYANELYRKWGLGDKEKNNGVLFLIAKNEQKIKIEVGYGLEGRINDGKAGEIIRLASSYFKEGQIDEGVGIAFSSLVQEVAAEYEIDAESLITTPVPSNRTSDTGSQEKSMPFWVKVLLVAGFIYLAIFHPDILMMIIYMFGRGGGGSGGSGGGGSRRGGGGSSGGGGASGGW